MRASSPAAAAAPAPVPGWIRAANGVLSAGAAAGLLWLLQLLARVRGVGPDTVIPVTLFAATLAWAAYAMGHVAWTGRPRAGVVGSAREALWAGWFFTFVALKHRASAADPRVGEDEAYLRAAIASGAAWLALGAIWRWYARGRCGRTSEPGAGSAA